ncbi:hypothetical protein L2E82_16611 [Cichorium intybus]|uniref:Uncharacterized protein n=1 Tax=Cichorium intybus TaxID=13427 RepID=A0ACB9F613_CICIN|nr:hypothetical protein L2E82_16611 [Cichorium intybus]
MQQIQEVQVVRSLTWVAFVAVCDNYDLKVDNFASLVDGKAMWCLLDYYFRKEHYSATSNKVLQVSQQLIKFVVIKGACSDRGVIILLVFHKMLLSRRIFRGRYWNAGRSCLCYLTSTPSIPVVATELKPSTITQFSTAAATSAKSKFDCSYKVAIALEQPALSDEYFVKQKLYPNVDFYSGLIYRYGNGIPNRVFSVLFAIPRMAGYLSHWRESLNDPDTKIMRPAQYGCVLRLKCTAIRVCVLSENESLSFFRFLYSFLIFASFVVTLLPVHTYWSTLCNLQDFETQL